MKESKLVVIDYMRFVAILSIVIWHCAICPYLCWDILDIKTLPIDYPFRVLSIVFFPDATMPLFTFISGYLFGYLIKLGKYKVFKDFVINKINRLIIPFIVIGTLVNVTSYDRYMIDIPWGEGSHLWYCCMLFWCFIFAWLSIKKLPSFALYLLFSLSLALQFLNKSHFDMGFKLPLGIHHSLYYLGYFISGYLLFNYQEILGRFIRYKRFLVLLYLTVCIVPIFNIHPFVRLFLIAHNYLYSVLLIVLLGDISYQSPVMGFYVRSVCKYSFGIYVFHEWISWNFCHVKSVSVFLQEHYILFPVLNTFVIFALSYVLTSISLKTRIGRYLLL